MSFSRLPSHTRPLAVLYTVPPSVHLYTSLLPLQPGTGKVPALGGEAPPLLLVNLPTDCCRLLTVHWQGCLQQLSDELAAIKTLMLHSAIDQKLDCFVWHTWWYSSWQSHVLLVFSLNWKSWVKAKTSSQDTTGLRQILSTSANLSPVFVCILYIWGNLIPQMSNWHQYRFIID